MTALSEIKPKNKGSKAKIVPGNKIIIKKVEDYKQSKPSQLSLFEILQPQDKEFSNTVELYDFMPKNYYGKQEPERIHGKFLDSLEREFVYKSTNYKLEIRPASIKDENGIEKYYYPSKREELVEDALRKFATEGQGVFLDDEAGVTFSLYQLQEELKRNGHSYSKQELKDALLICALTSLIVTTEDGESIIVSHVFETLGLQTREDWKNHEQKSKAFVRFNPLVTKSIKNCTFRQVNYEKVMGYKNVIARQLHKRMSHNYTQANVHNPYSIMLSSIIRDFGLTRYAQLPGNLRDVEISLKEMQESKVILFYKIEKILDTNIRKKLVDARFVITPHPDFISEVIKANGRTKQIKAIFDNR